jgi:hypothetical protein
LNYEGGDGYESGSGVAGALKISGSSQQTDPFTAHTGWIAIGYLGCSDAAGIATATGGSFANWLNENGVFETDGSIEEGQFSFWGHEHLYGKNGISGFQLTVGQRVFSGVQGSISTSGSVAANHDAAIALSYMNATKSSDTAYPTHN